MGIFNDSDAKRLADLESSARLADLEIETASIKDISKIKPDELTAGQIITLANVVESLRILSSFAAEQPTTSDYPVYAPPSRVERRDGETMTADEEQAVYDRLRSLLTGQIPAETTVPTVAGPITYGDIPKDADGKVPESWLVDNCTCAEHEGNRIDRDKANDGSGLYL